MKKIRSIAAGEKIAAEEIENLLLRHPTVIHAALVSMEDELMGEKSCAWLVVKEPLRAVQVRRFLREQGGRRIQIAGSRGVRRGVASDPGR
ncbi:enterobactin synthase subunit E [Citrobacter koseri]|uniref:Enterobactin synthase subunit E n=1 Tax=Citrobacter koseri TaxID=545 RepID=A0A2X2UX73_CITKO|nr:enterobactin synthase subunit E [Citrobacter koseri]